MTFKICNISLYLIILMLLLTFEPFSSKVEKFFIKEKFDNNETNSNDIEPTNTDENKIIHEEIVKKRKKQKKK